MNLSRFHNPGLGLLLIRLGLGLVFVYHGLGKWQNIEGTTAFFSGLGLSQFFVYLVAAVELLGGLALILGVLTEWAGWLLAVNMFFAIILAKLGKGFSGYEFELILLLVALGVALTGPGGLTTKKLFSNNNPEVQQ